MLQKLLLVLALAAAATAAEKKSYAGYKVLRVEVSSLDDAQLLESMESNVDFWTDIRIGGTVDIMVSPVVIDAVRRQLEDNRLANFVYIDDVQALINAEDARHSTYLEQKKDSNRQGANFDWDDYKTTDEIYEWFDYLEGAYDEVSTEVIGQTYEGRDIRVLRICTDGCNDAKPAAFIQGGIHAREWIGPATVTFMINELTEGRIADNDDLVQSLDWYFIASVNMDGYAYTISDDRMWRKTRSIQDGVLCVGTDPNRNFEYMWGTGGSSNQACSDTYMGPEPFSEVEVVAVSNYISSKTQIRLMDDIHSYSQLILHPWGYTDEDIPDHADVVAAGERGNEALYAVHQVEYELGCIPCILYVASGSSIDWTYGAAGIKYSYSMELRDTGAYGFLLPADQIIPTGEETFAFHASVARDVIAEFA